jgi:nucleoredoxin
VLIDFYRLHGKEKNFEIIFISSDRDEKAFNEYCKDMPWLTLSYSERKKKEELAKKYQLTGIPTLILIDADSGDVICKDARDNIQHKDTKVEAFPWKSL